jgi:hypothetical protein
MTADLAEIAAGEPAQHEWQGEQGERSEPPTRA